MTDHSDSHDDREALRILVRRARMLVQAEREGGIVDLPGSPAPAAEAEVPPAAPRAPAAVAAAPARPAAPPAPADPDDSDSPAVLVRALDLPADVLAPFGDLPERVAACRACRLSEARTRTVFGEGSPAARLVFCGEGPGFDEDRSGRPFVGRAGELLTAMIEKGMRLRREDVFILNAVKCRPPANRTPQPDEIAACRPFLESQLATIRPRLIVALGNPACRALLGDVAGIMKIRGREFTAFGATVVPTFHPSYVLRNPAAKADVWRDLQVVMKLLASE